MTVQNILVRMKGLVGNISFQGVGVSHSGVDSGWIQIIDIINQFVWLILLVAVVNLLVLIKGMFKWKGLLGLSLLGLTAGGYHQYHYNNSFRSLCNLAYAGAHMAYIYKYSSQTTSAKNERASQYLRDALKDNGGIYLKLGQLIATLDVIVPDEYRITMTTLTRECKVSPFSDVKATIEEELGYPLEVVFNKFSQAPISSASVAQVHKAELLNGQEVAVKVQHRPLAAHVKQDLQMMWGFVRAAKFIFKQFHYQWLIEQFQRNILLELDFKAEANNMKRTEHFLRDNGFKDIYVPVLLLKPTKRVLVMEYIHGIHLDQTEKLQALGINCKKIGELFSHMIIKMIHKEGFVHADPHSGNLMARKVKGKDQLVLLDHGLYQELDPHLLRNYNEFWLGLILNDPEHFQKAGRQLGTTNPRMLRMILTSCSEEDLNSQSRQIFDLNPSKDKELIQAKAAKNQDKIIQVLQELKREILLLLKVNEFARTIENMLGGREKGVYQDIAVECVMNLGLPWWRRWLYFFRMWLAQN